MNVFWKTIFGTVLTIAAIVSARYARAWIANHTFRANRVAQIERSQLQMDATARAAQRVYTPSTPRAFYTPPPRPHCPRQRLL